MPSPVIETLQDLVRINSVNPAYAEGQPEAACASYVAEFCRERGIETWEQEVHPGRPNLIARIAGKQPNQRIVFEAHTDTVTATDMANPFDPVIRDGRLHGRGSCDTKGGLAAMMHALAQVQASDRTPSCEIWLAATADEEHGFRGALKLCETLEANAAIVAEPTELRLTIACKGCVRWRIHVHGREAHSCKPHLGTNAIVHMAEVIQAIEKDSKSLTTLCHPLLGSPTCNIGIIHGGTQVNIVPEGCTIDVDRRLLPDEDADEIVAHYRELLDKLRAEVPTLAYTMEPPMLRDPGVDTPASAPIVQRSREVLRDMGLDSEPIGVPFSCDASKLSCAGVPSIVFGPGSIDQAHTPEEFVECEQVEQAVEFYYQLMTSDLAAEG